MPHVEVGIEIDRPVDEVFAYLSDIERQPEWVSSMSESTRTSSGPTGVGTTYRQTTKLLGRRIQINCEITEYEPPSVYAFRALNGPMHAEMRFTLTPEGQRTRLRQTVDGETAGFFRMADPIIVRTMQKQFEADLETLKTLLESGVAAGAAAG